MIDPNKPLVRRDGIAVDWIHETIAGNYVYGYTMPNGEPNHKGVSREGVYKGGSYPHDIINAPEYVWRNVYPKYISGVIHHTKEGADQWAAITRIGFIRHTIGTDEYKLIPLEDEE